MDQIPKIIHWCWFGPKKPPRFIRKYLASWRAYLPDYQIIRWNEANFDLQSNPYVKEAYEARKYAFVSDYVRLWALAQMGGDLSRFGYGGGSTPGPVHWRWNVSRL